MLTAQTMTSAVETAAMVPSAAVVAEDALSDACQSATARMLPPVWC
jgi:hypothetical protein